MLFINKKCIPVNGLFRNPCETGMEGRNSSLGKEDKTKATEGTEVLEETAEEAVAP